MNRKGFLTLILAVALVLSVVMTGCGASKAGGGDSGKAESIAGTYQATYEMKDLINKEMEAAGITLESDINAEFSMELKDDNSFVLNVDTDSLMNSLKDALANDLDSIIGQLLGDQGVTEDMYEQIAKAGGYDSYDAFKEDMQKSMMDEMDADAIKELTDACHLEGTWELKGSKLTLSSTSEGQISVDSGTVQDDGSIKVKSKTEDNEVELTFTKQQ